LTWKTSSSFSCRRIALSPISLPCLSTARPRACSAMVSACPGRPVQTRRHWRGHTAQATILWVLSPLLAENGNPKKSLSKKVTSMVENFLRVDSLDALQERRPTFIAIGVFDGVHL